MPSMQAAPKAVPGTDVYVKMLDPKADSITLHSGHKLLLPAKANQEEYATVEAEVCFVGDKCPLNLKPGERVAIHYHVTADYVTYHDTKRFVRACVMGGQAVWRVKVSGEEDGPDYFSEVLAVFRNGDWQGVGPWVIGESIAKVDAAAEQLKMLGLHIPPTIKVQHEETKLHYCSGDLGATAVQPGAIIHFAPNMCEEYLFPDGSKKKFLKTRHCMAVEVEPELGSLIQYTSTEGPFDGKAIDFYFGDEEGHL